MNFLEEIIRLLTEPGESNPEQQNYIDPSTEQVYSRAPLPAFNRMNPKGQGMYLEHIQGAPNEAFPILWPEQVKNSQGITLELIRALLQPYMEIQQTGMSQ
jgi:hypothetical protein